MPTNPLSLALNWLATHLVALSLLGFLVAGLLVSGVIDTGPAAGPQARPESTGSAPARSPPDSSAAPEQGPGHAAPDPGQTPGGPPAMRSDTAPQGPQLIGGALPMYQQAGEGDQTFRPPGGAAESGLRTQKDLLQQARRAFWNGDFEASEAAYLVLIAEYPSDANAFGELGNLYQAMGEPDRALDAYFEAAIRFKAAGEHEKLKEIIEVLRREKDERAEQLVP